VSRRKLAGGDESIPQPFGLATALVGESQVIEQSARLRKPLDGVTDQDQPSAWEVSHVGHATDPLSGARSRSIGQPETTGEQLSVR
jgi:hypothetical protein